MDYNVDQTVVAVGGSANLPATNELPIDMHKKVMTAFPELTPLTSILTRLDEDTAHNFQQDWIEDHDIPVNVIVATTLSAAGTALVLVANGDTIVQDSLLYNPRTFDIASADATGTTAAVTITRDEGGTTGAIWNSGDVLYVLPPALPENDATEFRNTSVADTRLYNLQQIVKLQYGITRVMDKITTHFGGPGSKRNQLKMQKFREVRRKWELMCYMGGRASSGTAPATQRMAGGLTHYLRNGTLYKDFNGIITESGFRNFLGDYKDQNPDATKIMLFAAGNVLDNITDFGLSAIRINPMSKVLGLDVNTYKARGLQVNMVPLPLLHDPVGRGWGFLLDLERIRLKTLDRLSFFPEAKNVGESEVIYDTYRVVSSMLLANESRHAMFVGALL